MPVQFPATDEHGYHYPTFYDFALDAADREPCPKFSETTLAMRIERKARKVKEAAWAARIVDEVDPAQFDNLDDLYFAIIGTRE